MAQLDASLVTALGLGDAATAFAARRSRAGLDAAEPLRHRGGRAAARPAHEPPGRTGRPRAAPADTATRAEAAFSAAQILGFGDWELDASRRGADLRASGPDAVAAPILQQASRSSATRTSGAARARRAGAARPPDARRLRLLRVRLARLQAAGYAGARQLASPPRPDDHADERRGAEAARIAVDELEPADVLFFGARGPKSKPAQVDHTGIYLGNGWFIHSSGYGVALAQLDGWYASSFAWARRPLDRGRAALRP